MKKNDKLLLKVVALAASIIVSAVATAAVEAPKSRYMGGAVDLVTAPNGAIANADVLKVSAKIMYTKPTVEKVAPGVWSVGGYSIANSTVIETDDGLIVYDSGDTREEGEHILAAIRTFSNKPVKVIIYSHSHYATGAGALAENPEQTLVIGHPKLNETVANNLKGGGAPSAIPEVGPVLTARTLIQFNNFMPAQGPDAALVGKLELGKPIAFLPVNKTVEDAGSINISSLSPPFCTR